MSEELKQEQVDNTNESEKQVDSGNADYLEVIKTLKENSVSKEEYEKIKADNKRLLDAYVNGDNFQQQEDVPERENIQDLRKKLFSGELNNLEYCRTALKLRDLLIDEGKPDPFLPNGRQITPTPEDVECANRCAQVMKECIETAGEDSQLFTNELSRRTVEAVPTGFKHK